jgi:hypothetical protein
MVSLWGFTTSFGLAKLLKKTVGIRVTAQEEEEGLDMALHGIPAYNDLERFSDQPMSDHAYFAKILTRAEQTDISHAGKRPGRLEEF